MTKSHLRTRGSTLVAAVIFIAIISAATGVAFMATTHLGRNSQRTRQYEGAIAVGDGHLEWAFAQWRTLCRAQGNLALPGNSFQFITTPTASWLPQPTGYSVTNFTVQAMDFLQPTLLMTDQTKKPTPAQGQSATNNSYYYLASADVSVPTIGKKPVTVKVRRVFEKRIESPWEYAIFYNDPLEIHPSPAFTVTGPVHSNTDIYASPDGGNALTFNDRVSYAGTFLQGYMDGDWQGRGLASNAGKAPGDTFAANLPAANDVRKDFAGITPNQFSTTDANLNNDSYRELIEAPVAGVDPLTDTSGNNPRLYNAASVRVTVDGTNTIVVKDGTGKVMSGSSAIPAEKLFYNTVVGALSTNNSILDYRESATVRLVTLDVSKLDKTKIAGWNGVVHISDTSASQTGGTPKRGVRLKNGATLPAGGLTVVSDNPVYIQGDYNTLGTRQPAAVMGDAIMILSNSWVDANSSADLITTILRNATDTTINTAILGGIVPTDPTVTGGKAYSGGVENFPRFMENWSGKTLTYNGSMVQLFKSQQAIGRWGTSSQSYNPPVRNWAYETLFRTTPPPGTLFITTYSKQRWYVE
jgi:hypothetical protein